MTRFIIEFYKKVFAGIHGKMHAKIGNQYIAGPARFLASKLFYALAFALITIASSASADKDVQVQIHGAGTITFPQGTGNCGVNCRRFLDNTQVTITALGGVPPATAASLWQHDCDTVNGASCTVATSADRIAHVYFVNTVTVSLNGDGKGKVLSTTTGINCGPECAAQFLNNRNVTLVALSDSTSRFTVWGGDCLGEATNRCTVSATQARNVEATFAPNNMLVTVTGDGGGTVTSNPQGIDCGRSCSAHFDNQQVTLTASPDPHSKFLQWDGACGNIAGNICILDADDVADVESVFQPKHLGILLQGLGHGKVEIAGNQNFSCTNEVRLVAGRCSTDVNALGANTFVTLTPSVVVDSGYEFVGWSGDCDPTLGNTPSGPQFDQDNCILTMDRLRKVRAEFGLVNPTPPLDLFSRAADIQNGVLAIDPGDDLTVDKIIAYLDANPLIITAPQFISALPRKYRENWSMMPRSESLQTGTAKHPRLILSSELADYVFTASLANDPSYPGSHPDVIEFMEWDQVTKNFRFHEIVLPLLIAPTGGVPERTRGVKVDDTKCAFCHSTGNVRNDSNYPGTDGLDRQAVFKSKPNWDTYDSWAGMLPFNRDRIYRGSIGQSALEVILNPWTWGGNPHARQIVEQLPLQPRAVQDPNNNHPSALSRQLGGLDDGVLQFAAGVNEPRKGTAQNPRETNYNFNNNLGSGPPSEIITAGNFVRLLHTSDTVVAADEGRGVNLFDRLAGIDGAPTNIDGIRFNAPLNARRIADEIIQHRVQTGNVHGLDIRPLALAILNTETVNNVSVSCLSASPSLFSILGQNPNYITQNPFTNVVLNWRIGVPQNFSASFFNDRHRVSNFHELLFNTFVRQSDLPRRKADLQRLTFDRRAPGTIADMTKDDWVFGATSETEGLFQEFDPATQIGSSPLIEALRAAVFQRSGLAPGDSSGGTMDRSLMSAVGDGIYIDREDYEATTYTMALFRYFLEPFGIPVGRWAPNVRGRATAYTFADVFSDTRETIKETLEESLKSRAYDSDQPPQDLAAEISCRTLLDNVADMFGKANFPDSDDVPTYTDVQRVLNRSCIECHNDLNLPPVANFDYLAGAGASPHPSCRYNLAEDTDPNDVAFGAKPVDCAYNLGNGTYQRLERLTRPHYWVTTRTTSPAGNSAAERQTALYNSTLYQRLLGPDHPDLRPTARLADAQQYVWEHCGTQGGQMPCGSPAIPAADIETIKRWILGGRPYTLGDPHIKTIDGTSYDFQAAGEYTYLKDPGFELQVRHTPHETRNPLGPNAHTGLRSCVSLVGAVAIQTGSHRITYQPDGLSVAGEKRLRIDGKVTELPERELALSNGARIVRTNSGFKVDILGGTSLEITPFWGDYLSVHFKSARATQGLGGNIPNGQWLPHLRDGSFLGPRPAEIDLRYEQLYSEFGQSWAVDSKNSLFDYEEGASPNSFTLDGWPNGHDPSSCQLPEPHPENQGDPPAELTEDQANNACVGLADADLRVHCVADAIALGDTAIAENYLDVERAMQSRPPKAPELAEPAEFATVPAGGLQLFWTASANGSAKTTYRACIWNAKTAFLYSDCEEPRYASGEPLPGGASGVEPIPFLTATLANTGVDRDRAGISCCCSLAQEPPLPYSDVDFSNSGDLAYLPLYATTR